MNVTVYRHTEYGKFIVTIDKGYSTDQFTLYDMSISELAEFVRTLTAE